MKDCDRTLSRSVAETAHLKACTESDIAKIRDEISKLKTTHPSKDPNANANGQGDTAKYMKREEVQELLREQQDAASRVGNVVLFGVPESVGDIAQICKTMLMVPGVSLPENTSIERIGKTM